MSTADAAARGPDELMAQVALLLNCAARLLWEHADAAGADSPLRDLGLGVYLAHGTAAQLLTADRDVDAFENIDERSVLELLTDAESLIGARADFISSGLAVELCDLIREARALGC